MGDSVRRLISEGIEWAPHCVCAQSKDVGVDHGRLDVGVAKEFLRQLTSAGAPKWGLKSKVLTLSFRRGETLEPTLDFRPNG
jgi:hypothetical protein